MNYGPLFDPPVTAKEAAIVAVEANANQEWLDEALEAVVQVAKAQNHLTTDDVWARLTSTPNETHDPRAMGPVMIRARKLGYIKPTSRWELSRRLACHARPLRVWESRVSQ